MAVPNSTWFGLCSRPNTGPMNVKAGLDLANSAPSARARQAIFGGQTIGAFSVEILRFDFAVQIARPSVLSISLRGF